ncbi:MAG: hypothetical protein M3Y91_11195 [Actinomycetota bacterium]|nr:hypothetical protein [Actinomycetota bacterium]
MAYLFQQLRLALVVPVAAAAITVVGAAQPTSSFAATPAYDPGLHAVSAMLVSQDRAHVYAGYWLSYVLSVASDEDVTASPTATVRDARYARMAAAARRTTYVFDAGRSLDQQMTAWSQVHHAGRRVMVANYAIWEFPTPMPLRTIPLDGDY